jgi:hypothetical protein
MEAQTETDEPRFRVTLRRREGRTETQLRCKKCGNSWVDTRKDAEWRYMGQSGCPYCEGLLVDSKKQAATAKGKAAQRAKKATQRRKAWKTKFKRYLSTSDEVLRKPRRKGSR